MKKIIFTLLISLAVVDIAGQSISEVSKQLNVFNELYRTLVQYYVDTLDARKNVNTAMRSMLSELDPYTEYYDALAAKDFNSITMGKYAGVGAVIHYYKKEDRCVVYELYEDKPAAKSGLRVGDVLLSVDDVDLDVKGSKEISDYVASISSVLRGDPETVINVKVRRPGVEEPMVFKVTRASVQLPSVMYSGMLKNNVGYVMLTSFTQGCAKEVCDAFSKLKEQGATSFVLDLRDNGGGLAIEAVNLVNLFVPKGKLICKMKGKCPDVNTSYATRNAPEFLDVPLVVLVNSNSASASEITCGSLQDLDRAVVMGERTYGKGLVQQTYPLPNGGMLKATVSHYYIPSGRCIQALDYSHRKANGEAYRTPDSLTRVFYTEAGREVRDGGGITPDVTVLDDSSNAFVEYLRASDEFFDYVTDYSNRHETIAPAGEFELTDDEYAEFVDKIVASGFTPEYRSLKLADQLHEMMKTEQLDEESLELFNRLKESLKPKIADVLMKNKVKLKSCLASEICARYYYQPGVVEHVLKTDKPVIAAVELLNNPARYKSLLSGDNKKLNKGK
ncbi:MAG: S41 family peptidase [Bacteroidaceae bacterium]